MVTHRAFRPLALAIAAVLLLGLQVVAQTSSANNAASRAVHSFYTFHLARNKDFTVRNISLRKRWLTPELYKLLLDELRDEAIRSKKNPDEAPYFEGDPLTNSQEYPDSFRVGDSEVSGKVARVTVTLHWSEKTSRGRDQRDIVVELAKSGAAWLINDIVDNQGSRLRDELKRKR